MIRIILITLFVLISNAASACEKDKVDIYKYVTDSKLGKLINNENCQYVNFLLVPKFFNKGLYLGSMVVNVRNDSGNLIASIPLAISEDYGDRMANACLTEAALKNSDLEFIFLSQPRVELTEEGSHVLGGLGCFHSEKVRLTTLLETHNNARQ